MSNPILNENTFVDGSYTQVGTEVMTKEGVVTKTAGLLLLTTIVAAMAWFKSISAPESVMPMFWVGIIGALITTIAVSFKRTIAHYLAPLYAAFEGLAIGTLSCLLEAQLPGIVYQAVIGTFAVFFTVLALYASRVIVVTQKVRSVIFTATVAVLFVYLGSLFLSLVGIKTPFLYDSSIIGIGLSILIMIIAASNFLIDFDNIERGVNNMAPKYYEWYCSFGLLVTLLWVYVEILKILARFSRRR